ncbi:MAG: FAD-dependent oxidoreductase [Verrucomicrobiota bacterium]
MKKLHNLSRRSFIRTAGLGAAGIGALTLTRDEVSAAPVDAASFSEPARVVPLAGTAEVIVCGAGPAGVTAAITAARVGAKVRLFEAHGALGGVWTSSLLGYLLDFNKPGFNQELVRRLRERDAIPPVGQDGLCYHPEEMKVLLEELCTAAGVKVQLHTRVAAAYREGRVLTTIVTESKSGRQAWRAPVFIDTTGDGDLGALADCEFEIGEAKDCPCQPMSMNVLLMVKDARALKEVLHEGPAAKNEADKLALLREIRRTGIEPSYGKPTLFRVRDNLLLVMMNHEYGVNATDAAAISAATMRARGELNQIVRGLRKLGGAWDGVQLIATPEQIGIRDGRRIRGRYIVTKDDVVTGARQDDAVVRPTFPVDIHAMTAEGNKTSPYGGRGVKVKPYDVPLRALIAKDVDGLMMAGRCISGDFIAHASYRVTGNSVAMGEAAGAVAAVAAQTKRAPHDVPWSEGQVAIEKARRQA